mmetsp:Transcript_45289/g.120116  ORF Transcript_45289/g.120116 Transcript_45289/m.120116 type:complete len:207 (-) Transcript_45289:897-1517(-)
MQHLLVRHDRRTVVTLLGHDVRWLLLLLWLLSRIPVIILRQPTSCASGDGVDDDLKVWNRELCFVTRGPGTWRADDPFVPHSNHQSSGYEERVSLISWKDRWQKSKKRRNSLNLLRTEWHSLCCHLTHSVDKPDGHSQSYVKMRSTLHDLLHRQHGQPVQQRVPPLCTTCHQTAPRACELERQWAAPRGARLADPVKSCTLKFVLL